MATVAALMGLGYSPPTDKTPLRLNGKTIDPSSIPPLQGESRTNGLVQNSKPVGKKPMVYSMSVNPLRDDPPNSLVSPDAVSPINSLSLASVTSVRSNRSSAISSSEQLIPISPPVQNEIISQGPVSDAEATAVVRLLTGKEPVRAVSKSPAQPPVLEGWSSMKIPGVGSMNVTRGMKEITLPQLRPEPVASVPSVPSVPSVAVTPPGLRRRMPNPVNPPSITVADNLPSNNSMISRVSYRSHRSQASVPLMTPVMSSTHSRIHTPAQRSKYKSRYRSQRKQHKKKAKPKPEGPQLSSRYKRPDYKNMAPDERAYYLAELENDYQDLVYYYPKLKFAEKMPEGLDLDSMHSYYERCFLRALMSDKANKYKVVFLCVCFGIELLFTKVFKLKATGYFNRQYEVLNRYERYIYQIIKKRNKAFGEGWSPEITILVGSVVSLIAQMAVNYLKPFIGEFASSYGVKMVEDLILGDDLEPQEEDTKRGRAKPQKPSAEYDVIGNLVGKVGGYMAQGAQDSNAGGGFMDIIGKMMGGMNQGNQGGQTRPGASSVSISSDPPFDD